MLQALPELHRPKCLAEPRLDALRQRASVPWQPAQSAVRRPWPRARNGSRAAGSVSRCAATTPAPPQANGCPAWSTRHPMYPQRSTGRVEGLWMSRRAVDEGGDDPTVLHPLGGERRDHAAGRSRAKRSTSTHNVRRPCGCGQKVFPTKNPCSFFARCPGRWQRRTRPPSVRPPSSITPHGPDLVPTKSEPNGGRGRNYYENWIATVARYRTRRTWALQRCRSYDASCSELAPEPGERPGVGTARTPGRRGGDDPEVRRTIRLTPNDLRVRMK